MSKSGIIDMVERLDGGPYYTVGQVAKMVGRDRDTIRKWVKNHEELGPSAQMPLGEKGYKVWLYTDSDVEQLKEFAKHQHPGRPPKEKIE